MNSNYKSYPFYSYAPSRIGASILAAIVYISLLIWLSQCVRNAFRPRTLTIMVLISHFLLFIELVLQITLDVEEKNTKSIFKFEGTLFTTSFQLFLASHFQCLLEMANRKKMSVKDIILAIVIPIGLISAGVTVGIGKTKAFNADQIEQSFLFRRISASIMIIYIFLFYVVWFTTKVDVRRRFVTPMLSISSACLLIYAIYLLLTTFPAFFLLIHDKQIWFYLGQLIPISIGLLSWSILFWFKPVELSRESKDSQLESQNTQLMTVAS